MMPMVEPTTPTFVDTSTVTNIVNQIKEGNDLDETRRLLYVLIAHLYDFEIPSANLRGTLYNALVHHHKLQTKSEMSTLFNDIRMISKLGRRIELSEKFGQQASKLLDEQITNYKTALKTTKETIDALTAIITKKIEG